MQNNKHVHPPFTLVRVPRPSDRETWMYPVPGKWTVRACKREETQG